MTERQRRAAKTRYERESRVICPLCDGRGLILTRNARTRAKQGGVAAYMKSLEPGQMSMSERGKRGGQPRALTLADIKKGGRHDQRPRTP